MNSQREECRRQSSQGVVCLTSTRDLPRNSQHLSPKPESWIWDPTTAGLVGRPADRSVVFPYYKDCRKNGMKIESIIIKLKRGDSQAVVCHLLRNNFGYCIPGISRHIRACIAAYNEDSDSAGRRCRSAKTAQKPEVGHSYELKT